MLYSREHILADVLHGLNQLADDWEYDGVISQETSFFTDLGMESLDIVVLATTAQEQYGQAFPFTEFFSELGQETNGTLTVGLWTDFIYTHLNADATSGSYKDQTHGTANAFNRT